MVGHHLPQEEIMVPFDELGDYWGSSWGREAGGVNATGKNGRWWPPWEVKEVAGASYRENRHTAPQACMGYSAPDWHKTPFSDTGSEGRANKVLLRLDVAQLQASWEVLVIPALRCWCWGSRNEVCLGGYPEVPKYGNTQCDTPLCPAETLAGGKEKSSSSLFELRKSHKKPPWVYSIILHHFCVIQEIRHIFNDFFLTIMCFQLVKFKCCFLPILLQSTLRT